MRTSLVSLAFAILSFGAIGAASAQPSATQSERYVHPYEVRLPTITGLPGGATAGPSEPRVEFEIDGPSTAVTDSVGRVITPHRPYQPFDIPLSRIVEMGVPDILTGEWVITFRQEDGSPRTVKSRWAIGRIGDKAQPYGSTTFTFEGNEKNLADVRLRAYFGLKQIASVTYNGFPQIGHAKEALKRFGKINYVVWRRDPANPRTDAERFDNLVSRGALPADSASFVEIRPMRTGGFRIVRDAEGILGERLDATIYGVSSTGGVETEYQLPRNKIIVPGTLGGIIDRSRVVARGSSERTADAKARAASKARDQRSLETRAALNGWDLAAGRRYDAAQKRSQARQKAARVGARR
jgi:hypothetical protein